MLIYNMKVMTQPSKYIGVQGIYAIININKPNKRCPLGTPYVGQAMSKPSAKKHRLGIGTRISAHRYKLRKNKHGNPKLQNAWNSYGEDSFIYVILEEVFDYCDLISREQFWIDKWDAYKKGYNARPIAESTKGFHIKEPLDKNEVIRWIKKYKEEHGKFPCRNFGKIEYCQDNLTWSGLSEAMACGFRGFESGGSLPRFIAKEFGIINKTNRPKFTEDVICEWFELFYDDHGYYPTNKTAGEIIYAKNTHGKVFWSGVSSSLTHGNSGLPGGKSLRKLIELRAKKEVKFKHWYQKGHI
jgi:group I intron endonuclease